jgi:ATP-dependent helicase/nuclease subunit A
LVEAGVAQCDIAVLLRQMTAARTYVLALRAQGLTVHADSAGGFFSAPEVADVRALLSTLANPRDEEALIGLLAGGLGGVSDDALYLLTHPAEAACRGGVWAALGSAGELGLDPGDRGRCVLVHDTVQHLRAQTGRMRLADILLDAAAALGPGGGCLSRDGAWANLRKAARLAAEFERVAQADPAAFLRHLEEREAFVKREASADVAAEGSGAIRVMTVHAAKGLEFPVVVVAARGPEGRRAPETRVVVKDGRRPVAAARLPRSFGEDLPLPRSFEEARDAEALRARQEEKRVLYVACTRAEEMLVLAGGAKLDKEPGERLAVDWVRAAIGDPLDPALPGVAVTVVTAERDGADVASLPGAPARAPVGHARHAAASGHRAAAVSREAPVPPTDLSYTALALYERCPYRFFAERVLGVGSLEGDDEGGGPRGLGLAVHAALQLRAMGREPDPARLDALARHHRLAADGPTRVARSLDAAAASSAAGLGGRPEVRFAVSVEGGTLVGTLDLLVRDGARALVIDYKTGAAPLGPDDARERFRKQADVYALALLRSGSAAVEVRFIEVERDGRETRFTYDAAQTEALEAGIAGVFAGIAAGRFPRLPAFDHDICSDCPVSGGLCPVVRPKTRAKRVR